MGLLSKMMFWKKEEALPAPEMPGMGPELGLPKEEELGLPKPGELGMPEAEAKGGPGLPPLGAEGPAGMPEEFPPSPAAAFGAPRLEEAGPPPRGPAAAAPTPSLSSKDLEIISLKLDSLKTTLEAINERLARLEKMAEGGAESPRF